MKITIKALNGSGSSRDVDFIFENSILKAYCPCKAGKSGQLCKHMIGLIDGDESILADSAELPLLLQVQDILNRAPVFQKAINELAKAEGVILDEEIKVSRIRKKLAEALNAGIEVKQ